MSSELSLFEYRELSKELHKLVPFSKCCDAGYPDVIHIEPLEGRNTLEVDRTCTVKCPGCGKQYLTRWD